MKKQENNSASSVPRMILFITGGEGISRRAQENLNRLCERELMGKYELHIVDVLTDFQAAIEHNVMVTPTLVVTNPAPCVTFIGDLRDTGGLREVLGLE